MTGQRIVFVTTEFGPITPGGAGTLVSGIARRLADQGRDIAVLLIGSDHGTSLHGGMSVTGVPVEGGFLERSMVAATALAELNSDLSIERVEFQDFEGLAFTTLSGRSDLGLSNVPITVRGKVSKSTLRGQLGSGGDLLKLRASGGKVRIEPL